MIFDYYCGGAFFPHCTLFFVARAMQAEPVCPGSPAEKCTIHMERRGRVTNVRASWLKKKAYS